MIGAFEVQKAVDAVLLPVLAALDPPVALFDSAPQGQTFPFVEFSRLIVSNGPMLSEKSKTVDVMLTVYSQFRGQEEVVRILAAIEGALDGADIDLDSATAVRCDFVRADTAKDADGMTTTGTAFCTVYITT